MFQIISKCAVLVHTFCYLLVSNSSECKVRNPVLLPTHRKETTHRKEKVSALNAPGKNFLIRIIVPIFMLNIHIEKV